MNRHERERMELLEGCVEGLSKRCDALEREIARLKDATVDTEPARKERLKRNLGMDSLGDIVPPINANEIRERERERAKESLGLISAKDPHVHEPCEPRAISIAREGAVYCRLCGEPIHEVAGRWRLVKPWPEGDPCDAVD